MTESQGIYVTAIQSKCSLAIYNSCQATKYSFTAKWWQCMMLTFRYRYSYPQRMPQFSLWWIHILWNRRCVNMILKLKPQHFLQLKRICKITFSPQYQLVAAFNMVPIESCVAVVKGRCTLPSIMQVIILCRSI